jgi:hypothetical protein
MCFCQIGKATLAHDDETSSAWKPATKDIDLGDHWHEVPTFGRGRRVKITLTQNTTQASTFTLTVKIGGRLVIRVGQHCDDTQNNAIDPKR